MLPYCASTPCPLFAEFVRARAKSQRQLFLRPCAQLLWVFTVVCSDVASLEIPLKMRLIISCSSSVTAFVINLINYANLQFQRSVGSGPRLLVVWFFLIRIWVVLSCILGQSPSGLGVIRSLHTTSADSLLEPKLGPAGNSLINTRQGAASAGVCCWPSKNFSLSCLRPCYI